MSNSKTPAGSIAPSSRAAARVRAFLDSATKQGASNKVLVLVGAEREPEDIIRTAARSSLQRSRIGETRANTRIPLKHVRICATQSPDVLVMTRMSQGNELSEPSEEETKPCAAFVIHLDHHCPVQGAKWFWQMLLESFSDNGNARQPLFANPVIVSVSPAHGHEEMADVLHALQEKGAEVMGVRSPSGTLAPVFGSHANTRSAKNNGPSEAPELPLFESRQSLGSGRGGPR